MVLRGGKRDGRRGEDGIQWCEVAKQKKGASILKLWGRRGGYVTRKAKSLNMAPYTRFKGKGLSLRSIQKERRIYSIYPIACGIAGAISPSVRL